MKFIFIAIIILLLQDFGIAFLAVKKCSPKETITCIRAAASCDEKNEDLVGRRQMLWLASASIVAVPAIAGALGVADGNLPDLPPEAVRSYLQYRIPLQINTDYFVFELQELMDDPQKWGDVGQLFRVNNNKGQGQPSRIERDYVNPMRIISLSMPPDTAEDLRDAQLKFEKAMSKITKATAGIRRDLLVEIDSKAVPVAKEGWDDGRVALN